VDWYFCITTMIAAGSKWTGLRPGFGLLRRLLEAFDNKQFIVTCGRDETK